MSRGSRLRLLFAVLALAVCGTGVRAQERMLQLSEKLGAEVDSTERREYGLFPDIRNFVSATFLQTADSTIRLNYERTGVAGLTRHTKKVSPAVYKDTRLHVELFELSRAPSAAGAGDTLRSAALYDIALSFAARKNYSVAAQLFRALADSFPRTPAAVAIGPRLRGILDLERDRKALIWPGSLRDHSGRAQLLVFSGYYGLWLGLATPIALRSDSPQAYAAGLLLAPPLAVLAAHSATRQADISSGRAIMVSLGGHLGTWQGIGWSMVADREGETAMGVGALAGLAGIGAAALLTRSVEFSEGHAALTSSGLQWGAWFGLTAGVIAGAEDDRLLTAALVGSDALVLAAGLAAQEARMSQARVRLINLAGLLGGVFGFGLDLLFEVDNEKTGFLIPGLTSAGGLALGGRLTRNYDRGRSFAGGGDGQGGLAPVRLSPALVAAGTPGHFARGVALRIDLN